MTEMDEIYKETSIVQNLYPPVIRYNTGLTLSADSSSQENNDCTLKIEILQDEPLLSCFTVDDDAHDTSDSDGLIIDEYVPFSSSNSKSVAPKRGINQTSVKVITPSVQNEPEDSNHTVEENLIRNNNYNDRQSKNRYKTSECINIVNNLKKEDTVVGNTISTNKDNSETSTTKNKINVEIEKKKIPRKEFLDEREKLRLLNAENKSVTTSFITVTNVNDNGVNDFYSKNLNNRTFDSIEVVDSFKKKHAVNSNAISLNKDNSDTSTTKNEINEETRKKKILLEEIRTKRKKLRLSSLKNKCETTTKYSAIDNEKNAVIGNEIAGNKAEYFNDKKRNIEEEGEKKSTKEINKEEHKKLMAIKNMALPSSSIALEIVKIKLSLTKGSLKKTENEMISSDTYENLRKKHDWSQKKDHQTKTHSFHYSSRSDFIKKRSQASSFSSDYYHKSGQYRKNARNIIQRPKNNQVYIGQIPTIVGKEYLYQRFKEFGKIKSLNLHKKPEFQYYYAFVTYSTISEAEHAVSRGNKNKTRLQLNIEFADRRYLQTQASYNNSGNEWYHSHHFSTQQSHEEKSFEEQLQEFSNIIEIDMEKKQTNGVSSN